MSDVITERQFWEWMDENPARIRNLLADCERELAALREEHARLVEDISAKHDAYAALDECHQKLRAQVAALVATIQELIAYGVPPHVEAALFKVLDSPDLAALDAAREGT